MQITLNRSKKFACHSDQNTCAINPNPKQLLQYELHRKLSSHMSQSIWSCPPASLRWVQDQPEATQYQDLYYSRDDGMAESHEVFVAGNHLPQRFAACTPGSHFTVAETGFGTGLNFLMTWLAWRQNAPEEARLYFVSCERHPLKKGDAEKALAAWRQSPIAELCETLLQQWPEPIAGTHRLSFDDTRVNLDICHGDATEVFAQRRDNDKACLGHGYASVNAWMLDGFAPSKNPELWQTSIYELMAELSHRGSTISTFTAAGHVRRGLQQAGFEIKKVPGFGRKRERLEGIYLSPSAAQRKSQTLSWHSPPAADQTDAIVVGAGLAGAHTARALAERGWRVTVLEKADVAAGSSGNPVAATFTRLSPHDDPLSRFSVLSYLYALRQLQGRDFFQQRGVLQLMQTEKQQLQWQQLQPLLEQQSWAECLAPSETSTKLGLVAGQQMPSSIWFPTGGVVDPAQWCMERLDHPNISLQTQTPVMSIHANAAAENGRWRLQDAEGKHHQSNNIVLCCAQQSSELLPYLRPLIKGIRGQLSQLSTDSTVLNDSHPVICHEGYLIATGNGTAVIGATYDLSSEQAELKAADELSNLQQAQAALAPLGLINRSASASPLRAAVRCASRDYLPLVGAVPDIAAMQADFEALRYDAKAIIDQAGQYVPGLYINIAHGSRGTTSVPLSAQYLASIMHGDPRPIERRVGETLSPARFVIRQLKRNQ